MEAQAFLEFVCPSRKSAVPRYFHRRRRVLNTFHFTILSIDLFHSPCRPWIFTILTSGDVTEGTRLLMSDERVRTAAFHKLILFLTSLRRSTLPQWTLRTQVIKFRWPCLKFDITKIISYVSIQVFCA